MGGFKLGGMTLGSIFKKPETTLYPFEEKPAPVGLKGTVSLKPQTCILCGICSKKCPCSAIEVDKKARTWTINHFRCVQCGSCILECPKKCLEMLPKPPHVTSSIEPEVVEVPEQPKKKRAEEPAAEAAPVAQVQLDPETEAKLANMDPEKAAKVRAAMAAKLAKEAKAAAGE